MTAIHSSQSSGFPEPSEVVSNLDDFRLDQTESKAEYGRNRTTWHYFKKKYSM